MRIARFVVPVIALLLVATLITTTQAQPQIGKLEIVKAFYGKNGHGNDVTRKLQRMIQNNTLDAGSQASCGSNRGLDQQTAQLK